MSPTFRRLALASLAAASLAATGAGAAIAAPAGITVPEGDSGLTDVTIPIDLGTPSLIPRTVAYQTADGTARAGEDYVAADTTALFAPLQLHQDVTIQVKADTLPEGDETFTVKVGGPNPFDQEVTIVNDDGSPTVSIGDATVHEKDGTMSFPVGLSTASGQAVDVGWETGEETAKAGSDYTTSGGTLSFAPGETRKSVTVPIIDDAVHEDTETLQARVVSTRFARVGDKLATGTILDDDPAPAAQPAPQAQQNRVELGEPVFIAEPAVRYLGLNRATHRVRLRLSCPKTADCPGAMSLRWGGKKIGGAPYLVTKGTQRVITVKLSAKAWRSLRRHHRLRLVAKLDSGRTARFTVKR